MLIEENKKRYTKLSEFTPILNLLSSDVSDRQILVGCGDKLLAALFGGLKRRQVYTFNDHLLILVSAIA